MRKRILSILTVLCLIISLMPTEALAVPHYILTVGNTNVSNIYEDNWDDDSTYYWKAAEAGDDAYEETGNPNDYLFSVSLDNSDGGRFTLTLNGVDITTFSGLGSYDYGIHSNIPLDIVLASDTTNSIVISEGTAIDGSYGVFASGAMRISADGSISASGGIYGISSWGWGASLDITEGTISSSGSAYGILVDGNVTISGGTVSAIASEYDGISATGDLTVSGGNITASGNRYALGVNGVTSISMDPYKYRTNTDTSAPDTDYTLFPGSEFINNNSFKYVEIMPCPRVCVSGDNTGFSASSNTVLVSSVPDHSNTSFWLNDVSGSITSTGAGSGNYNVKYNEATRTLTLKDANITSYYSQSNLGIYALGTDLNIVLEGDSFIGSETGGITTGIFISDGSLSISSSSGGTLTIIAPSYFGIFCLDDDISINGATVAISSNQTGISSYGDFSLIDGEVSVTSADVGISAGGDVMVTGDESRLNVKACTENDGDGICSQGKILIDDAEVVVEKYELAKDALWAASDIRISGNADMRIVDWSIYDELYCGLHSENGHVAIGEGAQIDICSQSMGIYAYENVYISYVWNGSTYVASGSPTVKINEPSSVDAITPETPDDFTMGTNAIKTNTGDIYMANGTLTAVAGTQALDTSAINLPPTYRYKTNTVQSAPDTDYTLFSDMAFVNENTLKYVEITSTIPVLPPPSGGRSSSSSPSPSPSRTITVTETSSELFSNARGEIRAEANMRNAFSNSVEVKVTDTDGSASGFNLGIGNTVYPFDISLYIKGTNTKTEPAPGYAVTIFLPIPDDLLDVKEQLSVAHKADNGAVSTFAAQLKQVDGIWYLIFEATEFSPYALIVINKGESYDETRGLPYFINSEENKVFIGFAAKGKYIAPSGVAIHFMNNPKTFTDISGHWGKDFIDFVTEREIFVGTRNDIFSPDFSMTRAMFATVTGRLYERSFGEIEPSGKQAFTDCDYDDYYGKYVDWAEESDILSGYGRGKFGPNDPVTREQMASILYRFANFLGALPSSTDTQLDYSDASSISNYSKSSALYCQTTGIISGRTGGEFAPQEIATRAEVATIIGKFVESVIK